MIPYGGYTLTNCESLVIGSFSPSTRSGCPGASVARPEMSTTGRRGALPREGEGRRGCVRYAGVRVSSFTVP